MIALGSPEFRTAVGKVLERARKKKNLYQREVGTVVGVRQSTIVRYESGDVTPGAAVFLRLIVLLEPDMKELIGCLRYDRRVRK